jgi:hypothetical protein
MDGCDPNPNLSLPRGPYFERVSRSIPYEDFSHIAKAKRVKIKASDSSYNLSEKQILSLSELLELMQQAGQEFK